MRDGNRDEDSGDKDEDRNDGDDDVDGCGDENHGESWMIIMEK